MPNSKQNPIPNTKVLHETKYLRLVRRGDWAFAQRTKSTGVVGIAAVTEDGKLLLIEQYRPPVDRRVIELPAGLVGDGDGREAESLETAARRELLEETGYEAATLQRGPVMVSSAGLSDETSVLFLARGLQKLENGGGDDSEEITVHAVPLQEVETWLAQAAARGCLIDARVYAGLYLLSRSGS